MTLQQLRYVVTVARTGNITEAAKQLFISQPSLTNAIRELEKEMQITIFNRTNKGVTVSSEGETFLSYARQVLEQADLLEEKFLNKKDHSSRFSVSCQHYSFAVNAFMDLIHEFGENKYDFTLRETQTYEIIEDVSSLKSEIGVIYTSSKNEEVILKLLKQNGLVFREIFTAKPHVTLGIDHPLADRNVIRLEELEDYPYVSFEQGQYNSFYFSEEILSTLDRKKNVKVLDRATLSNLIKGLKGYTVSTGLLSKELNGDDLLAIPLAEDDYMKIGVITQKNMPLSRYGEAYMEYLKQHVMVHDK